MEQKKGPPLSLRLARSFVMRIHGRSFASEIELDIGRHCELQLGRSLGESADGSLG